MTVDAWRLALDLLQFVVLGVLGLYVHLRTSNQVTDDKLETARSQTQGRLAELSERVAKVETAQEQGPTHEDIVRLHDRIDEMAKSVHELSGEFKAANRTLAIISEHLIGSRA